MVRGRIRSIYTRLKEDQDGIPIRRWLFIIYITYRKASYDDTKYVPLLSFKLLRCAGRAFVSRGYKLFFPLS